MNRGVNSNPSSELAAGEFDRSLPFNADQNGMSIVVAHPVAETLMGVTRISARVAWFPKKFDAKTRRVVAKHDRSWFGSSARLAATCGCKRADAAVEPQYHQRRP